MEKAKDVIDQLIGTAVNYRQSGHPGGSRTKVPLFLATLLTGTMRRDTRDTTKVSAIVSFLEQVTPRRSSLCIGNICSGFADVAGIAVALKRTGTEK